MKKSHADTLVGQIDELQKYYREAFATTDDIKALQGVERCIELKMKVWGFDGKATVAEIIDQPSAEISIDLSKLSKETLLEIREQSRTINPKKLKT